MQVGARRLSPARGQPPPDLADRGAQVPLPIEEALCQIDLGRTPSEVQIRAHASFDAHRLRRGPGNALELLAGRRIDQDDVAEAEWRLRAKRHRGPVSEDEPCGWGVCEGGV